MISRRAAESLLSLSPEHEGPLQGQAVCPGSPSLLSSKLLETLIVLKKDYRNIIEGDGHDLA